MSYAIRNDGLGWRAVAGPLECNQDETFSESLPVIDTANSERLEKIKADLANIDVRTPRAMREAMITGDISRVQALESEAALLRSELSKLST